MVYQNWMDIGMWVNTEKVKNKIKYYLVAIYQSESSDQSTKYKKNSTA